LFYSCWRGFVIRAKKDLKFLKYKAQVADLRQRECHPSMDRLCIFEGDYHPKKD
jgi:hypothetical protein